MAEPLLSIRELQSGYGDVSVLWSIDLDVSEGEIACIVGSNGAGKTTLLRTISGVVRASAGAITFAGRDVVGFEPDVILGAGIAHVPEGRRLFRGLSVRDDFPVLRERKLQDATTLSGGEQQMCALGRGIMSKPKLLMIDELSLGLAPQAVERMSEALREINRAGITILLVEQDVATAFDLAHHAFVIEQGKVAIHGEARALAADPKIRQAYMGI
jgi:branched-chain amino acid transport system ATP-binding protein